jgi:hypothetical protein
MAWTQLFTTDIGLLSLFTIAFCVVMPIYIYGYVKNHMASDAQAAAGNKVPGAH